MKKTECEKYICESIYDFISEKWDKIDTKKCDLDKEPKKKFLKEVRTKFETAMWVMTEVMNWSMDKDYYTGMVVQRDEEDYSTIVFQLGGRYIKSVSNKDYTHTVSFAVPKTKTVTYFD